MDSQVVWGQGLDEAKAPARRKGRQQERTVRGGVRVDVAGQRQGYRA